MDAVVQKPSMFVFRYLDVLAVWYVRVWGDLTVQQDIAEPSTKSPRMVIFIILVGMARALGAVSEDECSTYLALLC